jgi:hypothetical protein
MKAPLQSNHKEAMSAVRLELQECNSEDPFSQPLSTALKLPKATLVMDKGVEKRKSLWIYGRRVKDLVIFWHSPFDQRLRGVNNNVDNS